MLLLRRHLLPSLRAATPLPSPLHHRACPLATSPTPFSLEEFLVDACGLAPALARKTARKAFDESSKPKKKAFEGLSWSRLNSASNPRAVLALLSGVGLSRADIAAVVAADPLLLRASAKNIEPRLFDLRDRIGLSAPQIVCFLLVGSRHLRICDVVPRIKFLISFYGSFEKFVVVLKRCSRILQSNLERVFKPKIAFLQELGVPRSSQRFWRAVSVVAIGKETVAARLIYLKSTFGCYKSEVATAVSKMPSILGIPEESLHRKIMFLINEVGLTPQYIVERPVLFTLSLEKPMVPRHNVIKVLHEKGLLNSNMSFCTLAKLGEEAFKMRFIDCHKDSLPGLADFYAAACAGVVPSRI
ncbi:unnamed protein product [Urochloa decumbens]|uniref:Uncharacterized protein n=1 Tax=Urochloa decumbens TaxID=240449 RepID=A0ABC8ZNT8_9POAL